MLDAKIVWALRAVTVFVIGFIIRKPMLAIDILGDLILWYAIQTINTTIGVTVLFLAVLAWQVTLRK